MSAATQAEDQATGTQPAATDRAGVTEPAATALAAATGDSGVVADATATPMGLAADTPTRANSGGLMRLLASLGAVGLVLGMGVLVYKAAKQK